MRYIYLQIKNYIDYQDFLKKKMSTLIGKVAKKKKEKIEALLIIN